MAKKAYDLSRAALSLQDAKARAAMDFNQGAEDDTLLEKALRDYFEEPQRAADKLIEAMHEAARDRPTRDNPPTPQRTSFDIFDIAGSLALSGFIIAAGYFLHFEFVAISLVAMSAGRRVGWLLSRRLYFAPTLLCAFVLPLWGGVIAIGVDQAIKYFHPSLMIKVIFGYGMGAYISMPNYRLFATENVPSAMMRRHYEIQNIPLIMFGALSFWWGVLST
jgi:hypothetical protein